MHSIWNSNKKSHFLQSAFLYVRYIGLRSNSIFIYFFFYKAIFHPGFSHFSLHYWTYVTCIWEEGIEWRRLKQQLLSFPLLWGYLAKHVTLEPSITYSTNLHETTLFIISSKLPTSYFLILKDLESLYEVQFLDLRAFVDLYKATYICLFCWVQRYYWPSK